MVWLCRVFDLTRRRNEGRIDPIVAARILLLVHAVGL
jgi:hypothetical protein